MSDRPQLTLGLPPELLDHLAAEVASRVAAQLGAGSPAAWLDVAGAAEYLACPQSRVYDLVAAKRVRVAREGRRLLFRAEWLDEAVSC